MSDYKQIAERFARETASHQMTVLLDQGLYRHIRFTSPERGSFYAFDLITWPHNLVVRGDGMSFGFSIYPTEDWFDVVRRTAWPGEINAGYWGEKVSAGRGDVEGFSEDSFERQVKEYVVEAIRDGSAPRGIGREVTREIFEWGDITHEAGARLELESFSYEGWRFKDTQEWDFTDYTWQYLWACHAMGRGVHQYVKTQRYGLKTLAAPAPAREAAAA